MNFTYDYDAFCEAIARRDGRRCYVRVLLDTRGIEADPQLLRRNPAAPSTRDTVLTCDGTLDGHHLVPKQRIKRRLETLLRDQAPGPRGEVMGWPVNSAFIPEGEIVMPGRVLEDPRIGILACRRHHDLIERALLKLYREALPDGCEDAAAELGLMWSIERDYPLRASA